MHLGVRAGILQLAASDTIDAVYGGDDPTLLGVQLEVRFSTWFVTLAVDTGSLDGEQVAILPNGEIVGTGTATELELTPIHLTAGWIARASEPVQIYLGAGPTLLLFDESNVVASSDGNEIGLHGVLGARRDFSRWLLALEARYSSVPDVLGQGGASAFFGEDDLGGLGLHLVSSFRF